MNNERDWAGWQAESLDAISDAERFVRVNMPDAAVQCLERALIILQKKTFAAVWKHDNE